MRLILWSKLNARALNINLNTNKPTTNKIIYNINNLTYTAEVVKFIKKSNKLILQRRGKQFSDEFQLFNSFFRRLLSNILGAGVYLIIQRQLASKLTIRELAFVWELASRLLLSAAPIFQAQRLKEHYPWRYGAMALYLAISSRDTTLLVNWFQHRLLVVSLYQHQTYFRSLGFFLGQAVIAPKYGYNLQGSCLKLSGKISVAGNSRTRHMLARYGKSGASCLEQRITQSVFLVRTRTGCLGGTIQMFY